MSKRKSNISNRIDEVHVTNDCLTSRAGHNLFSRYLRGIDLSPHLKRLFGSMRKNPKGALIDELFKRILCLLLDGTSSHLATEKQNRYHNEFKRFEQDAVDGNNPSFIH